MGCRYTFELSIDPRFPEVPPAPGFPLLACRVSTTSKAYVSGTRHPLAVGPEDGSLTRFHSRQEQHPLPGVARVRVAQSLYSPFGDWVEGGIAASSARRSVASPITGTTLQQLDQVAPGRPRAIMDAGVASPRKP